MTLDDLAEFEMSYQMVIFITLRTLEKIDIHLNNETLERQSISISDKNLSLYDFGCHDLHHPRIQFPVKSNLFCNLFRKIELPLHQMFQRMFFDV